MTPLPLPEPSPLTQPYWDATKRGELAFQRCASCNTAFLYPKLLCPSCWTPEPAWEIASGTGNVIAFSIVHQAPYESYAQRVPYVVAMITLDEGPQLMANVVNCSPEDVRVGARVSVTFEERGDFSIPQFEPLRESAA